MGSVRGRQARDAEGGVGRRLAVAVVVNRLSFFIFNGSDGTGNRVDGGCGASAVRDG